MGKIRGPRHDRFNVGMTREASRPQARGGGGQHKRKLVTDLWGRGKR